MSVKSPKIHSYTMSVRALLVLTLLLLPLLSSVSYGDGGYGIRDAETLLAVWSDPDPEGDYVLTGDIVLPAVTAVTVSISESPGGLTISSSADTVYVNGYRCTMGQATATVPTDAIDDRMVLTVVSGDLRGSTVVSSEGVYEVAMGSNLSPMASGFRGTFDGNGHSITGVVMNGDASSLFSSLTGAEVRDVTIEGTFVSFAEGQNASSMASAVTLESSASSFIDVTVDGTVISFSETLDGQASSAARSGGISVVSQQSRYLRCEVSGTLASVIGTAGSVTGTISSATGCIAARSMSDSVAYCRTSATIMSASCIGESVSASSDLGMIAGLSDSLNAAGCVLRGSFSHHSSSPNGMTVDSEVRTGGIAGTAERSVAERFLITSDIGTGHSGETSSATFGSAAYCTVGASLIASAPVHGGSAVPSVGGCTVMDCIALAPLSGDGILTVQDTDRYSSEAYDPLRSMGTWSDGPIPEPVGMSSLTVTSDSTLRDRYTVLGDAEIPPEGANLRVIIDAGDTPVGVEASGCIASLVGDTLTVVPEFDWTTMSYASSSVRLYDSSHIPDDTLLIYGASALVVLAAAVLLAFNLRSL